MNQTENKITDIKKHLSNAGIYPTTQRLTIAEFLFSRHQHLTADQLYDDMKALSKSVSRATIYNSLNLFSEKRLVKEIHVNASRTFYDTNMQPHYHFYNIDSGELTDIQDPVIAQHFASELPDGTTLDDINITVQIRNCKNAL